MKSLVKALAIALILMLLWQLLVTLFDLPHFIMASPYAVAEVFLHQAPLLYLHSKVTLLEIILGLVFGFALGLISALLLIILPRLSSVLMPIFVLSQAIPVFAIAPLLVLWFGYGMPSKIVMAVLIIYFPVTASCYDGLRQTPQVWLDLAKSLHANRWMLLMRIRLPAALPVLGSGLRIAVTLAPIGAIVGEWVGASEGLGYLMLQANARMQTDLVFATLFLLMMLTLTLYSVTDKLLNHYVPWQQHR